MKDAEEDRATPEKTDRDSDDEEALPPPPKPRVRRAIGGKASKTAAHTSTFTGLRILKDAKRTSRKNAPVAEMEWAEFEDEPPPRRQLPFAPAASASPVADDSETDDEL
jgi:hypothetical protein